MIVDTVLYPNEVDDAANCKERSEEVCSATPEVDDTE